MPESITSIEEYAFFKCEKLLGISIHENISSIDRFAFFGCSNISTINIPEGITKINDNLLTNCTSLSHVVVDDSVTTIGSEAFSGCTGLSNLPDIKNLSFIRNNAFANCTGLTNITLPNSVIEISDGAFMGCTNLKVINFGENITTIGTETFYNCPTMTSVTIPQNVTSIEEMAFGYGDDSKIPGFTIHGKKDSAAETYAINNGFTFLPISEHIYSDWKSDSKSHWKECEEAECDYIEQKSVHIAGDWITDKASTETEKGSRHKECTVCKYVMLTQEIPIENKYSYEFIDGKNSEWSGNSSNGLSFTVDGDFDKLVGIRMDGKDVDPSNYTAKKGSTVIILNPEYLKTLSTGKHKISIVFNCQAVSADFTISKYNKPSTDSWDNHAATGFAGGAGTLDDPYLISNAEELAYLSVLAESHPSAQTNTDGKHFKLTADIDLFQYRWIPIGHSGWNIPDHNGWFWGYFDGNNKTISGLYVDETATECYGGLFGTIIKSQGNEAPLIQNLTISDATIKTAVSTYDKTYSSILCGNLSGGNSANDTFVKNVSVSGTITPSRENDKANTSGGLCGITGQITFDNCFADVTIKGEDEQLSSNAGGLFGMLEDSIVKNCTTKGSISGGWVMGGIAAESLRSTFENCIATISVEGNDWRLGGFTGYSYDSNYTNCASYGDVTATGNFNNVRTGGFAGMIEGGVITDCYAAGKVNSMDNIVVGGFVGYIAETVSLSGGFNEDSNPSLYAVGYDRGTLTDNIEYYTIAVIAQEMASKLTSNISADYSVVDLEKSKISSLIEENYKDFSGVNKAASNIITGKMLNEQYIVNGYAIAIEDAIKALELKGADYSKVDEAIKTANALNKDNYKDFSEVTSAIGAVVRDKDITEQDEVTAMATAIEDAIKALELKPLVPPVGNPKIIEGANQSVEQGKSATFKSNADFKDFQKVLLDGKELKLSNYTLKEGSTIVILKDEFIRNLSVGTHTLSIVSTTGSADAQFTIIKSTTSQPNTNSPQTGDASNMALWVALLFVSSGALTSFSVLKKLKQSIEK